MVGLFRVRAAICEDKCSTDAVSFRICSVCNIRIATIFSSCFSMDVPWSSSSESGAGLLVPVTVETVEASLFGLDIVSSPLCIVFLLPPLN